VGNGRGPTADPPQNLLDGDIGKAWNIRLRLEPGGRADGLVIGGNAYFDTIAASTAGVPYRMSERTFGGHIAYLENNVHFVAEGMYLQHIEEEGTKLTYSEYAAFGEFGYAIGDFTPYARIERVVFMGPTVDPYFAAPVVGGADEASAQKGSNWAPVVGVKYTVSDNLAVKVQAGLTAYDLAGLDIKYTATAQAAVAF
jgi:hypothetical protein